MEGDDFHLHPINLLLLDSSLWTKDDANLIGSQYPLICATLNSAG